MKSAALTPQAIHRAPAAGPRILVPFWGYKVVAWSAQFSRPVWDYNLSWYKNYKNFQFYIDDWYYTKLSSTSVTLVLIIIIRRRRKTLPIFMINLCSVSEFKKVLENFFASLNLRYQICCIREKQENISSILQFIFLLGGQVNSLESLIDFYHTILRHTQPDDSFIRIILKI
jgi:hypothetical protein